MSNIRFEYHNLERSGKNGESLARLLSDRGYRIERLTRYFNTSGFIWAARPLSTKIPRSLLTLLWSPRLPRLTLFADGLLTA